MTVVVVAIAIFIGIGILSRRVGGLQVAIVAATAVGLAVVQLSLPRFL